MQRQIKVAVIGVGHLGTIHARIYAQAPNTILYGVCDSNGERAQACADTYNTRAFTDYRQLLDEVDAVSIATPTNTHFSIARACLRHNIHTLVEKPITVTTKEAGALIRTAEKHNCILQVGHVERFNPAVQTIQELCRRPHFIECHRLSRFPQRGTDVSVVLDLMIHDIDIVLSLIDSPLVSCHAVGVRVLSEFEDIANARLGFADGTVCNLTASRVSDDSMRKIRIFEAASYISTDYASQNVVRYRQLRGHIEKELVPVPKKEPLREELLEFLDCAVHSRQPRVRGHDAKAALHIAVKISQAIARSRSRLHAAAGSGSGGARRPE